ncbi:MAG: D-TA family PLP-dependent enzyme [Planctomycetaceae bacterium]
MDSVYDLRHPEEILSPSVVLFREIVAANIDRMIEIAGGCGRLRPHCKTHKIPQVVQMQLSRGITRQKAATLAEAEMLALAGVRDIVLSYSLVGPNIDRAVRFVERFPEVQFAAIADDAEMIVLLGHAMRKAGRTIGLLLDINPGRDRTGVPLGETALELYRIIDETPGVEPAGLHLYDGHQGQSDFDERCAAVDVVWQQLLEFRDQLTKAGFSVPRLICGGSPTFPVYARYDEPTLEFSPGTLIFHDAGYGERFPDLTGFRPAALVLTRVIARPTESRVTFDVGTKGVASDPPMGQRVVLPALPDAVQVLQNEEHLVVETAFAGRWKPGDWTLAIPRHVCPTSALHQEVTVIEQGEIVDYWPVTARDRRLTI